MHGREHFLDERKSIRNTFGTEENPAESSQTECQHTWKNSFKEGSVLPCATMSRLFLLVFITIEGIMNKAFRNPQKMKVQFAPCQKPLTKKMIKVLRIRIQSPPLLPPRGM